MTRASEPPESGLRRPAERDAGLPTESPPCLDKAAYYDTAVFAAEMAHLYAPLWQFVGLRSELAEHNDFVTLDLPGAMLVVQNFKGELRAFQNICTHRFNKIQTEARGRRPLLCGYHGWNFNADGFPVGRPKAEQFPAESPERRARLCLPRYRVDSCGHFVFVNLSGTAPPLRDHLGAMAEQLEEISRHLGLEIQFGSVTHRANWKLLVENVLECLHCAIVHPDTFVASLGIGKTPIEQVVLEGLHSSCHFPRTPIKREALRRKILSHLDGRGIAHESFRHIHVFPNLFISSQEGLTFYVGHAIPVGPRETILRTRILEPKVELRAGQRSRQDMLNAQSLEIAEAVIAEDKAILENVQRGIELSERPGILGQEEQRIAAFFQAYRSRMRDRI